MGSISSDKATTLNSPLQSSVSVASKAESAYRLPEHPVSTIQPSSSWVPLNLRDVWAYRELLYFLTWRDLKVRYKQTALGVAWIVFQPLLLTAIFALFLGKLARVPSDGTPYPLFAYAGLLPWTFFSNALASSGNSLIGNSNLVTKVYFPRIIIPAAAVAARVLDFVIAFIVLALLFVYYGLAPTWNLLLTPVLMALLTLFALGFGMWVSAMNVRYRDVSIVLPVLLQLWMFASPVIYPSSLVPPEWRWLYDLNPLAGFVEGFRASFFGREFNWYALAVSLISTVLLLVYSAYTFRRVEKTLADHV